MKNPAVVLTKDQEKANIAFLDFLVSDENFFVIQGAAGCGKTFLIRHLLETFYSRYKSYCLLLQKELQIFDIKITATTNKAVNVVNDFLGDLLIQRRDINVSTIFSLLGLRVQNDRNTGKTTLTFNANQLPKFQSGGGITPLIFIDEASFIGEDLHQIIESILWHGANAKIVYIGDKYQLAPVGQTFSALESLSCTKVELGEIVRNKGHILATGTQFRETVKTGTFRPIQYNQQDLIHTKGPAFQKLVEASFGHPDWNPAKSRILAWTNERVQEYNKHIRKFLKLPALFQKGETVITNEYIQGSTSYSKPVDAEVVITRIMGDPITQYGVIGYMLELDHTHCGFMPIHFRDAKNLMKKLAADKDWKKFFEVKETWLDLRPVYASTINKAQGSTYETVFLDLPDIGKNWNANDVARLVYVGLTRASKQVVCYGYLPDRFT